MVSLTYRLVLLLFCLKSTLAQRPQDPLKNFCRRYGHQTAVIDRKLYIDGGWLYANPISQNPIPTMNQGLIFSDLDNTQEGMPVQYANLSKNSTVPDVAGGTLWADQVNKVFWLYGGEFANAADPFQLWGYDVLLDQWNISSAGSNAIVPIQRLAYGAGVAMSELGKAFYYGGYINNKTNPAWQGPPLATNNLIEFDMDENTLINGTGPPDNIPRAEGVMVSIPASARGMLVYFGGSMFPYGNGTAVPMTLDTILLYDIGDAKWVTQQATGQIPPNRRKFCAGATWAQDQSSYNIYLYGGFGYDADADGFDDVYILSMPTFTWIKWYPVDNSTSFPHGDLSCNVIDNSQMIVMGGNFTGPDNDQLCDVPIVGGQHNLNLGQEDYTDAKWYQFLPNVTSYSVPPAIQSVVGGSAQGAAASMAPSAGFNNSALLVYFVQKAAYASRTPTRTITAQTVVPQSSHTPTPKTHIGVIIGGAVGGVVVILAIIIGVFCIVRHRRRSKEYAAPPFAPPQIISEVPGSSSWDTKNPVTSVGSRSNYSQPSSPYGTPSPFPPGYDPNASYRDRAHGLNHPYYLDPSLSINSYGFQQYPMAISQIPGLQYYPPPEVQQIHIPIQPMEMPTAASPNPGAHQFMHQPVPVRNEPVRFGDDGRVDGQAF